MLYTSDLLIEAIKRNGSIPTSQRKFGTGDFLAFLNEELELSLVTLLVSMNQDYFIEHETIPLVASQSEYDFPLRAIGWKANAVGYVDTTGVYSKLPKINRGQRGSYGVNSGGTSPSGFYIEGTKIVTIPDMGASVSGSLLVDFVRIQNRLVSVNSCGLVTVVAIVGANYQITVNTVPSVTGGIDAISGTNPFNVFARGSTPIVAGFNLTCPIVDFERAPVAGDYLCQSGTTPIPNIPEDFHPVLAQAATIRCLISMSDVKGLQTAQMSYTRMLESMSSKASERVSTSPTKIVPKSRILNRMR